MEVLEVLATHSSSSLLSLTLPDEKLRSPEDICCTQSHRPATEQKLAQTYLSGLLQESEWVVATVEASAAVRRSVPLPNQRKPRNPANSENGRIQGE